MTWKSAVGACAVLLIMQPQAIRAADFISGVYARSPELCAMAGSGGVQAILDQGETVLSARGLEGIEYHCEFLRVLKSSRNPGYLVMALCEEPDFAFPDLLSVMPRGEGRLELSAPADAAGGTPSINSGHYHLCDGVAVP